MLVCLESFQNFDVIRMPKAFEDVNFVHNFLFLGLFLHKVHIDAFDGDQLPREPVQSEIDFSECSFAQHFPNFVEFQLSLGWLFIFAEAVDYQLFNEEDFLGPW